MSSLHRSLGRIIALVLAASTLTLGLGTTAAGAASADEGAAKERRSPSAPSGRQADPVPGVDARAETTSTISGLVYDEDGNLLDNILVEAVSAEAPTSDPVASDLTYEHGDVASHGAYVLHVPAGDYLVRFSSPHWADHEVYETLYYGGGPGSSVAVADADDVALDDVTLVRDTGAPVTGVVEDAAGDPMSGMEVSLVRFVDGDYYEVDYVVTDDAGAYEFPGVNRNRSFSVRVDGDDSYDSDEHLGLPDTWLGNAPSAGSAEQFTLPANSTGQALSTITMREGAEVTGDVVEPDGFYDDLFVTLLLRESDGTLSPVSTTWVEPDGTFVFPAAHRDATYTVMVTSYDHDQGFTTYLGNVRDRELAETFAVTLTDTTVDVGTILFAPDTSRVSGTLLDADGDPVEYAEAKFWQLMPDGTFDQVAYVGSDRNGRYGARLPDGGTFTVEARNDFFSPGSTSVFYGGATTIEAADTFTTPETTELEPLTLTEQRAKLVGFVQDEGGAPVAGADVIIWRDSCGGDACWNDWDYVSTNANGRYVFRDYNGSPADYTVSAAKPNQGLLEAFIGGVDTVEAATTYTLSDGVTTQAAPIVLTPAAGTVRGTISTSDGVPLAGETFLQLHQLVDDGSGGYYLEHVSSTTTEDDKYAFTNVPAGNDYTVSAEYWNYDNWDDPHEYVNSWLGGARPTDPTAPGLFDVASDVNPTTGVDLELQRGVLLSGTVTGADGTTPVKGASVWVSEWYVDSGFDNLDFIDAEDTDAAGHYSIRVPEDSEIFVEADRTGYESYLLGGSQERTNFLPVAQSDVVHPITMTPAWGAVGTVAGQKHEYCLTEVGDIYDEIRFDGRDLSVTPDGAIQESETVNDWVGPLDPATREPALVPYSTGQNQWDAFTWGISPDGRTLCVLVNQFERAHQALLTVPDGDAPGLDVTYNYDTVTAAGGTDRAGYTDGDGDAGEHVVFPGFEGGGYADGNLATGLVHNSLGNAQPGRYQFHFDGFEPRLPAPANTVAPSIGGDPNPGGTLTADPGTWVADGVATEDLEFSYQWEVRNRVVHSDTLLVLPEDAGRRVTLTVQAWAPGHDVAFASARTRIPVGPPAVAGLAASLTPDGPAVGDIVTADAGDWVPAPGVLPEDVTLSYRWFRNGNRIFGESASTYEVQPGDELRKITVRVTASAADHEKVSSTSAAITVADRPVLQPLTEPTLTGLPKVHETLVLDPGTWDTDEDVTVTTRWAVGYQTRNANEGSNGLAYTLKPSDVGKKVTAYVTAEAAGSKPGRWFRTVGPVAAGDVSLDSLTVKVRKSSDDAGVPNAWVTICDSNWECLDGGRTNASGDFTVQAVNGEEYDISVWPSGGGVIEGQATYTMPTTGPGEKTVELLVPEPQPVNVDVETANGTYQGVPTVFFEQVQHFTVTGCAGVESPGWTLTFTDGTAPRAGSMTPVGEPVGGIVTYEGTLPKLSPAHGMATVSTNIKPTCDPNDPPTEFNIYIDPSGFVTDQFGRTIPGATVTLLRADSAGGPFVAVPHGSDVMSPDNRSNPDTTDDNGFFRWDVTEGWYRVRAESAGCVANTTEPMQVLPVRVDLLIKLQCSAESPDVQPTVSGTPKLGAELSTNGGAWPEPFGVSVQWLRDGEPIVGATDNTYELTAEDVGKQISVRHVADRPTHVQEEGRGAPVDFTEVTRTAPAVVPAPGDALTALTPAAIAGSGKVGTTLTTTAPEWSSNGVSDARQWFRGDTAIDGATGATYDVVPADVGESISVRYTGTKPGHPDGSSTSNGIVGQLGDAPAITTEASVAGSGKVGTVLTATAPVWNASGFTVERQWLNGGEPITGETGETYEVRPSDIGDQLSVRYTASRNGYTTGTSTSNAKPGVIGDAPVASPGASIAGSGKVGSVLTATAPTWNDTGFTVERQWLNGGQPIDGATGPTYEVRPEDVGDALSVRYTASRNGYTTGTSTSNLISGQLGDAPVVTTAASIDGSGKVGSVLTATAPSWNVAGFTVERQWLNGGQPIDGETGETYEVQPEDIGDDLSVRYTATRNGYATGTSTSTAILGVLGDAPVSTEDPQLTGNPVVGQELTVSAGTWEGPSFEPAYQWLRDGAAIDGATGSSYLVTTEDAGSVLSVRVIAQAPGHAEGSALSNQLTVAKLVSTTTAKLAKAKVPASKTGTLKVTVTVPDVAGPLGKVKVTEGTKVLKTVTLTADRGGKISITLPKLKKGKHKLVASYLGDASTAGSKSKAVTLTVT